MSPANIPATDPPTDNFELAVTSCSGRSTVPGTTAAFVTRYSFENTSVKKATGNNKRECTQKAMKKQQMARPAAEPARIALLLPRPRSTSAPSNGPTMANGATVSARERATFDSAALVETLKKMDPASATATIASPAEDRPWTTAKREKAEGSVGPSGWST